ncbi:MAG: chromate transporter, partial [Cryomorphaceae bacterium]
LDSVNVAAVAVMVSVLFNMGEASLIDWRSFVIAGLSTILFLYVKKMSSMWLIVIGAVMGFLLSFI